jgi:phosphatidate cytidylyltransferase
MFTPAKWVWWALLIACTTGALEMLDALEYAGRYPARFSVYVAAAAAMPLALVLHNDAAAILPIIIIAGSMLTLFTRKRASLEDVAAPLYIAFSTIIPAVLLMLADETPNVGRLLLFISFTIPLLGDTFALFVGRTFGRHKLTALSPNKTVEGALSGLVGSVVGAVLFGYVVGGRVFNLPIAPLWHFIALGIAGGILGQLGDLSSSLIKRQTGIKDFGALFPGHGGIMDRLDSVLFAAYAVYVYSRIIIR